MPLSFPSSPSVNDTYTAGSRTWTWNGSIWELNGTQIGASAISTNEIADSAITTAKIAAGAVAEVDIATGAVTETKIGANAVTQAKLSSTLSGITICTSSTRPGTPFSGQMIFETNTNKVLVYYGGAWNGVSSVRKIAAFSSSGTWTVPSGVTYAVANLIGGGGGIGSGTNAGNGGNSSVAFASGTVSATGGNAANINFAGGGGPNEKIKVPGVSNSGYGAKMAGSPTNYVDGERFFASAGDGARITAGADVTPGASISVTVGAGGAAGTYGAFTGASGGSGYVWIEYEV
jgi:hypothetical protein